MSIARFITSPWKSEFKENIKVDILLLHRIMNNLILMAGIRSLTSVISTINPLLFILLQVSAIKIIVIVEVDAIF